MLKFPMMTFTMKKSLRVIVHNKSFLIEIILLHKCFTEASEFPVLEKRGQTLSQVGNYLNS